jgi:hypothetical protein
MAKKGMPLIPLFLAGAIIVELAGAFVSWAESRVSARGVVSLFDSDPTHLS